VPPEDRILTVPNVVSLARLACVPWFVWLLFGTDPPDRYGAALLLAMLGCTDWIDGWIARRYRQVSTLGKVLDPTADRIMLLVGVGGILLDGSAPVWVAVAVLVREALVSLAVVALAAMGARRIDVQWAGKAGTFACMVAFPLFLTSHSTAGWADLAGTLAWLVVLPGLVLAWYAAVMYVPMARTALAEGRVGSTP
jgi:cardiolipin synthase